MITLITGVPGSSKTLNTINEVLTNDTYKNRPVYYYNIPEVTLDNWEELTEDQAKEWFKLPHGSVVVLDECQRLFRPMRYGDKVPPHIEELETHRHLGIDIFAITQHPKLIDTKVRRLVGRHLHYKRVFGMESATQFEFQTCADDPDDYFSQQESIKKRVRFPKNLYGVYKSSEEHTHKRKMPKKLYGIAVAFLVTLVLLYKGITGFGQSDQAVAAVVDGAVAASPVGGLLKASQIQPGGELSWHEKRVPREPGVPWSAPLYDGVYEVKTFPRPQCIRKESTGVCNCYTQQATPIDVTPMQCEQIVSYGYFDPTAPDSRKGGESRSSGAAGAPADGSPKTAHERNLEALRIRAQMAEIVL